MKKFFVYKTVSFEQVSQLLSIEPKLTKIMDWTKPFTVRIMPDHYQCFIHSVISQQLSSAAVDTIWNRLVFYFKKVTPKIISKATIEQLQGIGLSKQKITLIKKVSYDIVDKKLDLNKLEKTSNDDLRMILTQYKYLGDWTVDMLLMFTYYRNDILPMTDYGIRQGLSKLYHVDTIEEDQVNKLKLKLGQHATIFSFCLWRISQGV